MLRKLEQSKIHAFLTASGWALLLMVVSATVLHFSWNMAMPDLFGAEEMKFKQAFGLIVLVGALATLIARCFQNKHFTRYTVSSVEK